MAAFLIALKERGNDSRVLDLIHKVVNCTPDDLVNAENTSGSFDAAQNIVAEYSKYMYWALDKKGARKEQRVFEHVFNEVTKQSVVGSTKRGDKSPQLDFLLYMIDEYVKNPRKTWIVSGGLKSSAWEDFYHDYLKAHA
jgi:hypothetical protein